MFLIDINNVSVINQTRKCIMGNEIQDKNERQMLIEDPIGRKILDAAMEIIEKEGYDNLTIRRVAKESGCSNTAIYIRFEDKNALTRAVAELYSKPFLIVMDEKYVSKDDFFTNIRRMTHAALERVYSMDIGAVNLQVFYRAGLLAQENPFVLKLEGYIKSAVSKGEIKPGNNRMLAYSIESSFWGIAYMLKGVENKGIDIEQAKKMLDFYINLIFSGIRVKEDEDIFWNLLKDRNVDVDKALERMKGNKDVYKDFLTEFFEDPDFTELKRSIDEENAKEAFEYAHGLKGMAANLGLDAVHEHLSVLVEILRLGELTGAREAYYNVMQACQEITELL